VLEETMSTISNSPQAHVRALADGNEIPLLALGVWQVPDGPTTVNAVRWALELGYRHVDTAQVYGNEQSVGRGLLDSGIPRNQVFITTKFNPSAKDPVAELERSLDRLGVDHVDLYLIHWPERGATWAWPAMERARQLGYTRSIGVSNFGVRELEQLLAVASTPPVVNQIQLSPFEYRRALLQASQTRGIVVEAYSPLGTGRHLSDATVRGIAAGVGRTPAQVLLRWCVQRGVVVLTKSTHRERIQENAAIFDFTLSEQDMAALDALDRSGGTDRARERPWWRA
jgi:diketogulonate reductase-like aldo/keto reductase